MPSSLDLEALQGDLAFVERQLSKYADPYDTVRFMWEQRKEALLEEIARLESHPDNWARVALLFEGSPVIGSEEIRLDFTTKALDSYQNVVATVAATRAGSALAARGPIPRAFGSKLFIRDMARGSVGFVLEEPRPDQLSLVPSLLKEAVEETNKLIDTLATEAQNVFDEHMTSLSPRTFEAIKTLVQVLHNAGAEAKIAGEKMVILDREKRDTLYVRMTELEYAEHKQEIQGMLLGLFPERQQYEFRTARSFIDGHFETEVLYGPVSEFLDDRYITDAAFARSILLKPALAHFTVTSTLRGGILLREERMLDSVDLIDTGADDDERFE